MGSDGASLLGGDAPKAKRQPPDPAEVEGWLTGSEVTALGVTPRALSRWSENGVVQRAKDAAGQWRFNPADIEQQRGRVQSSGSKDEVLEAFRAMLAMQVGHLERTWALVHEPSHKLLELMSTENDRLAKRNEKLEDRHLQFLELFEKLMTNQHQRELEARVVDQREARKDKAFGKLTDAAPAFLQQVFGGMGASALVKSITDEQLQVLTVAEFLTDEQKRMLKAELGRRAKAKAKEESDAAKTTASKEAKTEEDKHG
jgi:DNA-binding transcriptional MerR regulator